MLELTGYQWLEKWQECIALGQLGVGKPISASH
jgi:hypothetical protein